MAEPSVSKRASVFLVDDHPLVRESLTSLINQQSDLFACGEAEDAATSLREIARIEPDVAIIDLSLKSGSGMDLIRSVKARTPNVAMIVLSMHDEKIYAERAIRAGARGYVMKRESTKRIIAAIRHVLQGRLALSEQMAAGFAERFVGSRHPAGESPLEGLSDRELEVFTLLGRGLETRRIAETLNVSIKTVQAYCARIKQKRNLSTAAELLREAIRWNEQQGDN
ncbi:MAG TPA: response regulator transcription factor [Rhizomicrobium sp.]|nr:response regulator transcription factor [Rhizomicrobium sp.]